MRYFFYLFCLLVSTGSYAKSWRLNNNAGVTADFTTVNAAASSALVQSGDTLYIEPSATEYATGSIELTKRLVFIGPGYFLDPANGTQPGNPGLQLSTSESRISFLRLTTAANGTKFLGITVSSNLYLNNCSNISFEKVLFNTAPYMEAGTIDHTTFRKCFFAYGAILQSAPSANITNFVVENCGFYAYAYINLNNITGTGNIFRNNTINAGGVVVFFTLYNTYVVNNIFNTSGSSNFTNCTIKNNLFKIAQTLPGTATDNQLLVDMNTVITTTSTGSLDSRMILKPGSPAISAGLTVGPVINPDCGAFGGTDPYKLSGIPNIPSIYALTVPTSVPAGSATMNISFSSRNNN